MIINTEDLKKKIIYRSTYRGTKEMDKLLSSFTKKYINTLNEIELNNYNYKRFFHGEMAERLKAPVLKTGKGATLSWVRIPVSPPLILFIFKISK